MKSKFFIAILLVSFIGMSCDDEAQLQQSIFIEDPENPGLPKYSEMGYNTFGAYYDRQTFTSSEIIPMKVVVTGGNTSFIISGVMAFEEMSITVTMAGLTFEGYGDLMELDDVNVDLTGEGYTVVIENASEEISAEILNGTFHFIRTQNLLVDKQIVGVVLSGTFEFQALIDGEPVTVSGGRFDVSIGEDNFFVF